MPKIDNGRVVPETGDIVFVNDPSDLKNDDTQENTETSSGSVIDMNKISDVYGINLGNGTALYAGTDVNNTTRILKFKTISTDSNIVIADFGNNIKISLSDDIAKGIVDVSKGGTGVSFLNNNQLLLGNGTGPIKFAPEPENNKVLSYSDDQYKWLDAKSGSSVLIHTDINEARDIENGEFSFYTNKNSLTSEDFTSYDIFYNNNGSVDKYSSVLNTNFQIKLRGIDGAKQIGYTPPLMANPSTRNTSVDSVLIRNAMMFDKLEHSISERVTTIGNNSYVVDESDTNWDVQKFHSGNIKYKNKNYRLPDLLDSIVSSNIRVPRILKTVQNLDDGLNRITIFDVSINKEETYYVSMRDSTKAVLGKFELESDGFYSLTKIANVPSGYYYDKIGLYDFGIDKTVSIGEKISVNGDVESFVRINSDGSYVDIPKNNIEDRIATRPVMLESSETAPDCGFFVDNGASLDFCVFSRNILTPEKPKIINKDFSFSGKYKQLAIWGDRAIIAGVSQPTPSTINYSYRYCFDFATINRTTPYIPVWSTETTHSFSIDPTLQMSMVECASYTGVDEPFVLFGIAKGPYNSRLYAWVTVGFDVIMKDLGIIANASNDDIKEMSVLKTQSGYKITYTIEDLSSTSSLKETYIAQIFINNDRLISAGSSNLGIFKGSIRRSSSMSIEGNINHGSVSDVQGIYNGFNGVCIRLELKYISPISKISVPVVARSSISDNEFIDCTFSITKVGDTSEIYYTDDFNLLANGKSTIVNGLFTSSDNGILELLPGAYYIKLHFDNSRNDIYPLYTELHGEYHGALDRGVFRTFGTAKYDPYDPYVFAYDYNNTIHPGLELEFNYFI